MVAGAQEHGVMPERVGRYDVLLPIGSGGMATVYLARARGVGGFERHVALKLTHAHLRGAGSFAPDLVEEAKLAAQVRHPNVVSVLDVGQDAAGLFLVMEYIEGDTLASLVDGSGSSGLPLSVGLRILLDALAGLHAAHELRGADGRPSGLVHRDFSPHNILVGSDGVARLADFGVAKAASRLGHTQTGLVKGKISYMAPEQARGLAIDRRCDVWAAGVVGWELLAGRRLRDSDNDAVVLLAVVTEEPPPLSSVRADVPSAVSDIIAGALQMDPAQRCPDASTLARQLAAACRAGGIRIAEHAEVAEHVTALVGTKIHERRERAAEAARLRLPGEPIVTAAQDPRAPVASRRRLRSAVGAGLLTVAAVGGVALVTLRAASPAAARAGVESTGLLAIRVASLASRNALPDAPAPPASSASAPVATLSVTSTAPLSELMVAGKRREVPHGATDVELALAPDEVAAAVELRAVSTDGRKVTVTAPPGAHLVAIAFPGAVAPSRRAVGGRPPDLAPSPYEAPKR